MSLSVQLAQIMGPLFLLVALGAVINRQSYAGMVDNYVDQPGLTYLGGLMAFAIGMAIVLNHNVWSGFPAIITLLGWLAVIKGALLLVFPKAGQAMAKGLGPSTMIWISAAWGVVIGVPLIWYGYLAG